MQANTITSKKPLASEVDAESGKGTMAARGAGTPGPTTGSGVGAQASG